MPASLAATFIDLAEKTGRTVRRRSGVVTDDTVWPPLIDCGGGPVATPVAGNYVPADGDVVICLEDWDGRITGQRVCIGRVAQAGRCLLLRNANQSATGSATTTVSWDTAFFEQGDWITPTSTNITVPAGAGAPYSVHFVATGAGAWANNSRPVLRVGGNVVAGGYTTGGGTYAQANFVLPLAAASVITAEIFNAGATQNMTARIDVIPVA